MGISTPDKMYKDHLKSIAKSGKFIDLLESGDSRVHELDEYYVGRFGSRTSIPEFKIREFFHVIDSALIEEDIQKYLKENPQFLTRILLGNHGSWCIPKPQFSSKYRPDFLIAELDSMGFRWYGVELENPRAKMYTKRRVQSAKLTEALDQIDNWRIWLKNHIQEAQGPIEKGGLSLIDIDCNLPCFVFIGRRKDQVKGTKEKRLQIFNDKRVEVHHYDWLIERARPSRYIPRTSIDSNHDKCIII